MKIYSSRPKYDPFVENEVKTLTYLDTRAFFNDYSDLALSISAARLKYSSELKKKNLTNFDFHSEFTMEVEGSFRKVMVGANVTANFQECSYFLALTDRDNTNQIIRKFHFDYADKSNPTVQKVPSYHMQYGGKASPHMPNADLSRLDSWLSLPRISLYPMNLALLLDIAFCEFRTAETNKIVESAEWRSLIYCNECFLSKDFYEGITSHLHSQAYNKTYLLRDFCYGS